MKHFLPILTLLFASCIFFTPVGYAVESTQQTPQEQQAPKKKKRAKSLNGTPVHVNIAGGGSLPKGVLLTVYNSSFGDKTNGERGYNGSDVYSQAHLLKIRYGLTDHWEINSTGGYINNGSRNPSPSNRANHMEGILDQSIGFTYSPTQIFKGEPVAVSFSAGLTMPTGFYGDNHLPGNGAWGGRLATSVCTYYGEDLRFDTELVWTMPFERGNQKVRRGDQYQWNTMVRYLFDWFDVGFESSYVHTENGDKATPRGHVNMYNGSREWYIGPSMNFAIDDLGMWVGTGVFFPIMQDMNGPSPVDNVQYHLKVGKMW